MLLLLAAACGKQAPDPATTAQDPCAVRSTIELDRRTGVFPLPIQVRADTACLEGEVRWDFGDGTLASGTEAHHTYLGSGSFTVTMTIDDVVRTEEITVSPASCPQVVDPVQVGTLGSDELDEASGLSHSPSGLLWTHNDSGDTPRLFAMSTGGDHVGTVQLVGAADGDWEDSTRRIDALGQVTLYVGDVGDNAAEREAVVVYLVDEPQPDGDALLEDWTAVELVYPDGPRNADTLMVDPVDGALLIVADDGGLYRKAAPHVGGERATLEFVATLELEAPTGGDISPLGDLLAVRSGTEARVWPIDRSLSLADSLAGPGCELPPIDEVRGEALAFDAEGKGYFTVSEELYQPIWYTELVPVEQPCAGLEAVIVRTEDGPLPWTGTFTVDPECVPAGIDQVAWEIDGQELDGSRVEASWLASGSYPVEVTITDRTGAQASAATTVVVEPQDCPVPGENEVVGEVQTDQVVEASGLAVSQRTEGLIWTHNDSGGVGELFALSLDGLLLDRVDLDISSGDWEDLAYAETELGLTLFVGDVGDNAEARDDITIYLVPEADPQGWGEMTLTYDDGLPHNCESIAIDPQTGELVVITKSYSGETEVFVKPAPHVDGDVAELSWIASLDTSEDPFSGGAATTAADFSPLGNLLAVRTYTDVWLFRRDAAEPLADAFARAPCDGQAPDEQQGEAIAFAQDGSGYFLLSEGEGQPLNFVPLD